MTSGHLRRLDRTSSLGRGTFGTRLGTSDCGHGKRILNTRPARSEAKQLLSLASRRKNIRNHTRAATEQGIQAGRTAAGERGCLGRGLVTVLQELDPLRETAELGADRAADRVEQGLRGSRQTAAAVQSLTRDGPTTTARTTS